MTDFRTESLILQPLTLVQLQTWLRGQADIEAQLGVKMAGGVTNEVVLLAMSAKVKKMQEAAGVAEPANHLWYTYWLMRLQAAPVGVGLIGYKGPPNSRGEVEIGYGVAPAHRGKGYTTEAVEALLAWAWTQPECQIVRAVTLKNNKASHRVLQKAGLVIDQVRDEDVIWRIWRETAVSQDY